jgi:general secretion pathway protein J
MASYKQGRILTGRKGFKAIQAVSAFTLVEMLVVVGILGFIGLASFDMASMGVRVKRALIDQEKVMFDSIRLWQWIERDMEQLVDRTVRDELGEYEFSLKLDNGKLDFTKAGWINPLGIKRSELQRVSYEYDESEGILKRTFWRVLDKEQDVETLVQEFDGVSSFSINLLNTDVEWTDTWPPVNDGTLPGEVEKPADMPWVVQINMATEGLGLVSRMFAVPSYPFNYDADDNG